jgi:hypothetical protein
VRGRGDLALEGLQHVEGVVPGDYVVAAKPALIQPVFPYEQEIARIFVVPQAVKGPYGRIVKEDSLIHAYVVLGAPMTSYI